MLPRIRLALAFAIGAPVLVGVVVGLVQLLALDVPHIGWAQAVAADSKAIAGGHLPYADPSEDYTGLLYTPGFPLLLAPLYRMRWWDGWPVVIDTLAALTLAGLSGLLAVSGRRSRWVVVEAAAVAGTSWWLVSSNFQSMLRTGRADHLAWLFALAGLCALARAVSRSAMPWVAALLLTAAVWTKQPTVGAMVTAVAVLTVWAVVGTVSWRTWWRFVALLASINTVVLATLLIATGGWMWHFIVTLPRRHAGSDAILPYPSELLHVLGLPVAVLAIAGLPLVTSLRRRGLRNALQSRDLLVVLATVLGAFVLIDFAPAWIARRKQGAAANQYVGMAWAMCLLLGVAWRVASRRAERLATGVAAYVVLSAFVWVPPLHGALDYMTFTLPGVYETDTPSELDPAVVDYAATRSVFLTDYGVVGSHRSPASVQPNVVDLLAAGDQPRPLVDALIGRRFDAVSRFDVDDYQLGYVSLSGRTSADYLLALNLVIDAGYAVGENGAPAPLLGRRSEDIDLAWMERCFRPGQLAACEARVAGGSG